MHKILIVGEHDGKTLNAATAKCVTCASGISDGEITIVLLGADTAATASQAAAIAGPKIVRVAAFSRTLVAPRLPHPPFTGTNILGSALTKNSCCSGVNPIVPHAESG